MPYITLIQKPLILLSGLAWSLSYRNGYCHILVNRSTYECELLLTTIISALSIRPRHQIYHHPLWTYSRIKSHRSDHKWRQCAEDSAPGLSIFFCVIFVRKIINLPGTILLHHASATCFCTTLPHHIFFALRFCNMLLNHACAPRICNMLLHHAFAIRFRTRFCNMLPHYASAPCFCIMLLHYASAPCFCTMLWINPREAC
ncbi:hypothetical protein SAMN06265348_106229 [Pedobacter westerhofensis]|uniref:Uncharacterized protein n=1 Tax=Pedobacter westerhofensis TaxID=425512 RepID=A0A521DV14_9SPHI|nr:hypothetical protein SAMN06265348_106229 [Pedobacter westerhofensis]